MINEEKRVMSVKPFYMEKSKQILMIHSLSNELENSSYLKMLSAIASLSTAIQVGSLSSQNWAETTVVNWAVVSEVSSGVEVVTSSQTHRVPEPDIEQSNYNMRG